VKLGIRILLLILCGFFIYRFYRKTSQGAKISEQKLNIIMAVTSALIAFGIDLINNLVISKLNQTTNKFILFSKPNKFQSQR